MSEFSSFFIFIQCSLKWQGYNQDTGRSGVKQANPGRTQYAYYWATKTKLLESKLEFKTFDWIRPFYLVLSFINISWYFLFLHHLIIYLSKKIKGSLSNFGHWWFYFFLSPKSLVGNPLFPEVEWFVTLKFCDFCY